MENGDMCAFPADAKTQTDGGLTKREYFAAMAMQGILAGRKENLASYTDNFFAKRSVKIADSLLAELDKTKSE